MILYAFAMAVCKLLDDVWKYHTITFTLHDAATIALPNRYPTD
jgi:hypothetical protein